MKNIKNEKGSLALFVTIAMLFFITFILVMYIATINEQKTQLAITTRIKETYEKNIDEKGLEATYNNLVGTDEYIPIYTADQLRKVGKGENVYVSEVGKYYKFNLNSNYILKNNIDLNEGITITGPTTNTNVIEWTPIGTESNPFTGIFDGNNYIISGLYINDADLTKTNQGLFGINGGTIKNVILDKGYIKSHFWVGAIAAQSIANSKIENCVNNIKVEGRERTGGICGGAFGTIENCTNNGIVNGIRKNSDTSWNTGGIFGYSTNSNSVIKNCVNTGNITSTGRTCRRNWRYSSYYKNRRLL